MVQNVKITKLAKAKEIQIGIRICQAIERKHFARLKKIK